MMDLSIFDPHVRSDCPECGHGAICSPKLCSRNRPVRSLCTAMLQQSLVVTAARLTPNNVLAFVPKMLVRKVSSL